jgi:hypothetical protein
VQQLQVSSPTEYPGAKTALQFLRVLIQEHPSLDIELHFTIDNASTCNIGGWERENDKENTSRIYCLETFCMGHEKICLTLKIC